MTLSNSCSSVKVGMHLSETFNTVRSFRQGDPLSRDLFNFVMECSAGDGNESQWLYLKKKKHPAAHVRVSVERQSTKMFLVVNEDKSKYMLSTSRDVRSIRSQITPDNYTLDTVKEFVYLGSTVRLERIREKRHTLDLRSSPSWGSFPYLVQR